MGETQPTPKLTKAQKAALAAIAAGAGSFHRDIGERLEAMGLAYPIAGLQNFISNCNQRTAWGWALTDAGAMALRPKTQRANRPAPKIDRGAVMADAWHRWRYAMRRGWHLSESDRWTWQRCLKLAWAAARQRRDEIAAYHAKPRNGWAQDVPFPIAA
jgi:hypothetical protein